MDQKDDFLQFQLEQQLHLAKQRDKELLERFVQSSKPMLPSLQLAAAIGKAYNGVHHGAGGGNASSSTAAKVGVQNMKRARRSSSSCSAGVLAGRKAAGGLQGLDLAMRQFLDDHQYVNKPPTCIPAAPSPSSTTAPI